MVDLELEFGNVVKDAIAATRPYYGLSKNVCGQTVSCKRRVVADLGRIIVLVFRFSLIAI
jgi:hypothetical protein